MIKIRGLNVAAIKKAENIAKKIANDKKWVKGDGNANMFKIPNSLIEYMSPTNAYKLLGVLDVNLRWHGLSLKSKNGKPLLDTSEEEFDINAFVDDGRLYLDF